MKKPIKTKIECKSFEDRLYLWMFQYGIKQTHVAKFIDVPHKSFSYRLRNNMLNFDDKQRVRNYAITFGVWL